MNLDRKIMIFLSNFKIKLIFFKIGSNNFKKVGKSDKLKKLHLEMAKESEILCCIEAEWEVSKWNRYFLLVQLMKFQIRFVKVWLNWKVFYNHKLNRNQISKRKRQYYLWISNHSWIHWMIEQIQCKCNNLSLLTINWKTNW